MYPTAMSNSKDSYFSVFHYHRSKSVAVIEGVYDISIRLVKTMMHHDCDNAENDTYFVQNTN